MQVKGSQYMVLEDLCCAAGPYPSILDLKMGQLTAALDASPEKVRKAMNKFPHQQQLGFRITGMKVETSTFA